MRVVELRAASLSVLAVTLFLSACGRSDEQIKVYRVVKAPLDSTPPVNEAMPTNSSSPSSMPGAAPVTPTTAAIPPSWEAQPPSQMRQASFLVSGDDGSVADISFVTLGPAAGNVLDNVNRWLGQLSQPSITADKLADIIQELSTARGRVTVVDLTGTPENGDTKKDGRILAAIASDPQGTAFYKMRGNQTLVGAEKENFLRWVKLSRETNATVAAKEKAEPSDSDSPQIKWDLPESWSPGVPSPMRFASFTSETNGEKADISVVTFPGEGGSDLENVNRWRQQIGLPAVEAGALSSMISPTTNSGISFSTVDMSGETTRTIAGWTRHQGRTWFFKLTGPKQAVEREKTKFVTFIQSVRF